MKVAIMQPYLFPYIGYWQLINAVDRFILLDDVNYIMRGYINRNSILVNGKPYKFTVPIEKASQNKLIMESKLNFDDRDKMKLLQTFETAYKKAPYYEQIMPMIERIVCNTERDVTKYIYKSLLDISSYLKINTSFYISSKLEKNNNLHAQERIIEICKKMKASVYINPCGGRKLYSHEEFRKESIKLFFLDTRTENIRYKQNSDEFVANLSIIDILMFNDVDTIKHFLEECDLNE